MQDRLARLQELVDSSHYIVFFGGAGVSTESGIPDFRGKSGIYTRRDTPYPPEVISSHNFFMEHPDIFYQFYGKRFNAMNVKPNAAHYKLAEMERAGKLKAVITQNIDDLHQKAGSQNVLLLHGSMGHNYCMECGREYPPEQVYRDDVDVPRCTCGGIIRPGVVLYGENLDQNVIAASIEHIAKADLLIVGGTSLAVYPAAGFINYFNGDNLVIINRTPTPQDSRATLLFNESIAEVLGQLRV